jgi:hypothetical protein
MGGLANKEKWTKDEVKQRLEDGEELSTLEQTKDAGGWRLSATIHQLKKEGLPIASYRREGFGKCAFYRLLPCMYQASQTDIFGGMSRSPQAANLGGGNA